MLSLNRVSHSEIMQALQEKQSRQTYEVKMEMPSIMGINDFVYLGAFSWYLQNSRHRIIHRTTAMNFDEGVFTPGDLARTYIDLKYPKLRATKAQIAYFKLPHSQPLYANPVSFDQGVYIDIKSAYWQIMQIIGWDVDYYPNMFFGRGLPMDDWPYPDLKLARNCLVTAGLNTPHQVWDGYNNKFKELKKGNPHCNMGLWAAVMDILHGVAADCLSAGAQYVHTDGYICDSKRAGAVMEAIASWGLVASQKGGGLTKIFGVGTYTIGDRSTANPKIKSRKFRSVQRLEHHNWLKSRFLHFAERTTLIWKSQPSTVRYAELLPSAILSA